jgi:hypothetical protein
MFTKPHITSLRSHQQVKPGYMREFLPREAPEAPEKFEDIMKV